MNDAIFIILTFDDIFNTWKIIASMKIISNKEFPANFRGKYNKLGYKIIKYLFKKNQRKYTQLYR